MKTNRQLIVILLFILALPMLAQKRKAVKLTPEQQEHQQKLERMTANTQRIMFIDSTVVAKQQFLQAYHLAEEVGQIARSKDYAHSSNQSVSISILPPDSKADGAYLYVNELKDRCFFSQELTDTTMNILTSEAISGSWIQPDTLRGINDDGQFQRLNFPFMMGDGFTFYFAAEGGDGLGGYDIYVTRYDAEESCFLHPANIGMPFNSEANDYMYVIDEYSNLGWFATDRNQPTDSVCVYVFIPPTTRLTYQEEDLSTEQLTSLARLDCIAQTWYDEEQRQAALRRLQEVSTRGTAKSENTDFHFVINDALTYSHLSDFQSAENRKLYQQLISLQNSYRQLLRSLEQRRESYANASPANRESLRTAILADEQKQHELYQQIHDMEKQIRNNEILFLTKKQ